MVELAGEPGELVAVVAHDDVGARAGREVADRADLARGVVLSRGGKREQRRDEKD